MLNIAQPILRIIGRLAFRTVRFVDNESISTVYGTKILSNYSYLDIDGSLVLDFNAYVDTTTNTVFKMVCTVYSQGMVGSMDFELIDTNMPYVPDAGN